MKHPIKILHLEDVVADTELVGKELQKQDISFERLVVNSKEGFTNALHQFSPDVILADNSLPYFTSVDALQVVHQLDLHIPFILVSGTVSDDLAIKIIKQGADDYIMKDRLHRLPTAVLNTIEKYRLERERKRLYREVRNKQKKASDAVKLSNERYALVAKVSSDMVWDWNLLTGEVYRSKDGWEKIFSATSYNPAGTESDWDSRIHPDDLEKVNRIKEGIFNSSDQYLFKTECRVLADNGAYIHIEDNGYIMRDEQGKPVRVIGASKNITEQKQAEEELKKLSLVAHQTTNAVMVTDTDQKIQWVNEAFTRITGFTHNEVIGKKPGDFLQGPETSKVVVRYMRMKIKKQVPYACDIINYTKAGQKIWLRVQCQPEFDTSGQHIGYFAIQTDITKEKEAEEALRSSEERHRYLFNNNPACMFLWDIETLRILDSNETASKLYGYSKEEFLQLTILDLRKKEEWGKITTLVEKIKLNPELKNFGTWKHMTKKGEDIFMDITSHQIPYNGRQAVMAMANDVTEKIILQQNLEAERAQKQNEITNAVITAQEKEREQIGRELHDNVNQILASSLLYLGVAKRYVQDPKVLAETDQLINSAIKEIRILSHSMIPPSLEETSLQKALYNIIKIVGTTSSFAIHNKLDCVDESNMPDKLKLSIYRIVQEQLNNIHKYAKAKNVYITLCCDNKTIVLYIKDDGIGFDTAKKYEGVGLMNIKTRASLYNGKVTINSAPDKGCELCIVFEKDLILH